MKKHRDSKNIYYILNNFKMNVPKIFTPRLAYKPFEYPEFFEDGWMAQMNAFWMHTEVPMNEDIQDWRFNLKEHEREIVGRILLGFAQTECAVSDYWTTKVVRWFPKSEIQHMAMCFGSQETIHAQAYSYLNETLGLDNFEAFMEDKTTADKLSFLIEENTYNDSHKLDYKEIARSLAIFSAFAEGVNLFSSFAILLSFQPRNMLKGIGQIISWSVRDESLHSKMGCRLFELMCKEIPNLLDEELIEDVYKASDLSLSLEMNFVKQVFQLGTLPNINEIELENFLKYRINNRLECLGIKPKHEIDEILLNRISWFEQLTSGVEHQDFFAQTPTAYSKSTDDWSLDAIQ